MTPPIIESDLFIDGGWRPARGGDLDVESPADGSVVGRVGLASVEDVADAVGAAAAACRGWGRTSQVERIATVERLVDQLRDRTERFAELIGLEQGSPPPLARKLHVDVPIAAAEGYLAAATGLAESTDADRTTLRREPIGVVAAISPWNVPLHQAVIKVVPALLAGNSVVLKPSELTPLTGAELARAVEAIGLPPGVFNLINGTGAVAGQALVEDLRVDHISFTGSTATGERVAAAAAKGLRRVTLELGGKSPSVVLADCSPDRIAAAVKVTVADCFLNGGQTCTALSRLIVPADRLAEVEELAAAAAAKHAPGTRLGPLISAGALARVERIVADSTSNGTRQVDVAVEIPERGHFMAPVVLSPVAPDAPVAQEEIFGPVLAIIPVSDDAEAIAVANGTDYGLTATVWSDSEADTVAAAARIRAGQVNINGAAFDVTAPFGGYKRSGLGRELGLQGLEEMYETKAVVR